MNGLYPIIRRVRRPLLPVEPLRATTTADAKPVIPAAAPDVEKVAQTDAATQQAREQHGEATSSEPAK